MAVLEQTRFIERLQFFNGQRLFAPDLQGVEAFNREMRWLHNKSLHQPGIGSGFAVYGKKGERQVTIGPGYAVDALGREIVLTESYVDPVPPVAAEPDGKSVFYDLTVSYPDDSELEEAETREGVCLPRGVVRLREAPVFCWVRLKRDDHGNLHVLKSRLKADIKNGIKVILSRIEVLNCQLENDVSIAQRRSARPAKQPYIACGVVNPTDWKPWIVSDAGAIQFPAAFQPFIFPVGLTAYIETSPAKFVTIPHYSARITGPRIKQEQIIVFIVDGLVNIRDPGPKGFAVDVLLLMQFITGTTPGAPLFAMPTPAAVAADFVNFVKIFSDWYVVWTGVEG